MATLYISSSLLKRDTALGSTVDDNLLQPYIRIAQDRWNSVITNSSEQGQPSSTTDIKRVVEQSQEIGMFYRERLIEYICFNASSFPQYVSNTGADVSPSRRNYFGGLNVYPEINWSDNQLKAFASAVGIRYLNA